MGKKWSKRSIFEGEACLGDLACLLWKQFPKKATFELKNFFVAKSCNFPPYFNTSQKLQSHKVWVNNGPIRKCPILKLESTFFCIQIWSHFRSSTFLKNSHKKADVAAS